MNLQQARRTLGITPEDDKTAIKKKYRRLMGQFHPDAQTTDNASAAGASDSIRKAQEINEAYEYLKKHTTVFQRSDAKPKGTGSRRTRGTRDGAESIWKDRPPKKPQWTGKINAKAFCERNVYLRYSMDVVENTDKLYYQAARGRFLWNPETEDFTLFVTSLHHATKELLEQLEEKAADVKRNTGRNEGKGGTDARTTAGKSGGGAAGYAVTNRFAVQSKLFYHLSAQFTDPVMILQKIAKPEKTDETGRQIYHFHTSLGADATQSVYRQLTALQSGDAIYPLAFRENKIIVCRQKQYPLGHLSFEDDRLYFSLIPLLQEKLAQVQMKVRKVQVFRKRHPYKVKVDIDLYFRTEKNWKEYKGRDRNLEIAEILRKYEDSLQTR